MGELYPHIGLQAIRAAVDGLLALMAAVDGLLALDSSVWYDNAGHFTSTEVDAIAELLVAGGKRETAQVLLEEWIRIEVHEDREANEGDWSIDPHRICLVDNREEV